MMDWNDGQPYSARFGDVYFSAASGLEEKRHVFLAGNRLGERFAAMLPGSTFCVGEVGFGTGLNFLCAWELFARTAPPDACLDIFSVEKYPLEDVELAAAIGLWPELQPLGRALEARWRRRVPGWNRWSFGAGRVRLTLALDDAADALPQLPDDVVDAWFLDGFAPAKNPESWSEPLLREVARAAKPGATLATYTSAGWVRRGLQQAGFGVARRPGFGSKREMTCAWWNGNGDTPGHPDAGGGASGRRPPPRTAMVIGGGIAGAASARALAQRGIQVTLVERSPRLASAGSGNPRGMLHARLGASGNALQRLVLAAYGHALATYDDIVPVDGVMRSECGLLELAWCDTERTRIERLAALGWPSHLVRPVDASEASTLAGVPMRHGGLWLPAGGWLRPPGATARLATHEAIALRLAHEASTLDPLEGAGWKVGGTDAGGRTWAQHADVVVVCCAHSANRLAPFAAFPLTPVRGQITVAPATAASAGLRAVICGDGYCAPAIDGAHVLGATHGFEDEAIDVRAGDNAENLQRLAAYAPDLCSALGALEPASLEGRASIRCSAPGATPFIGRVHEGLYCSLAHGTRGLITAGIGAELIAAEICATLPPLPRSIVAALSPMPRIERLGRRKAGAREAG